MVMDIEFQEFLNKDMGEIYIEKEKIINLLYQIKAVIEKDKQYLEQASMIDFKKWKKKIDVDIFLKIVDIYKEIEMKNNTTKVRKNIEKMIVSYYGNPYVTFHLCIQAMIYQKQLLLETGEFMLSTNHFIINMMNQILEENHMPKLITQCIEILEKKEVVETGLKTIIIGANNYKANYFGKYTYIPYNHYIIYCPDEELEDLSRNIYAYASNNRFETEVLFEEDIEEAIQLINLERDSIAVILTKDTNLQNLFKEKIKNKLYINENPFAKEEWNIPINCLEMK